MSKYLYGAAVQGIQDFIFRTNKLQHIVGASELVEEICTHAFDDFAKNGEDIVRAAGNIKFIFENEKECKKAVREFPRKVMTMAPGITISQAVVPLDGDFSEGVDLLEARLKNQRNKPSKIVTSGLMGIKRSNTTGLPITSIEEKKEGERITTAYYDDATKAKQSKASEKEHNLRGLCKKSFGDFQGKIAYNISDITGKNDWIAIIHADGNGLGKVVQTVGKKKDVYKTFSKKLSEATIKAAHKAYKEVSWPFDARKAIPIRPVVLSGDDMTVIIRGDIALDYANAFIKAFEKETQKALGDILRSEHVFEDDKDYLTACAGVAFIKSSFPFYYGYDLAEELCGQAKKDTKAIFGENSKQLPPSCLMFHKVQDSFIFDYRDIVQRELTCRDNLTFKAGPYYIEEQAGKHTYEELIANCLLLDGENGDGVKSGIRNWIALRLENKHAADQRKERMMQIFADTTAVETLTEEVNGTCLAYDALAYHTIMNQQTNEL